MFALLSSSYNVISNWIIVQLFGWKLFLGGSTRLIKNTCKYDCVVTSLIWYAFQLNVGGFQPWMNGAENHEHGGTVVVTTVDKKAYWTNKDSRE